jgi:cytochrome c biogenesis protein CcdA
MKSKKLKVFIIIAVFIVFTFLVQANEKTPNSSLEILFFYNPGCYHCLKFKNEILPQILEKTNRNVKVKSLDISKVENYQLLLELEEKFPIIGKGDRPRIFVGDVILVGEKSIKEKLIEKINTFSRKVEPVIPQEKLSKPTYLLLKRFKSFHLPLIATAGLVDGLNPCAFAIIVFFISFLTLVKYQRKEIAVIGFVFLVSVFITYFLLGLGILRGLQRLAPFYSLAKGVNFAIGIFAIILAFLSFRDVYIYKKTGKIKETKLKLPLSTHNFIHRVISKYFRYSEREYKKKSLGILSCLTFLLGILIAVCTAACTGEVYLPTIVFMLSAPNLKVKAIIYLIIYNLMYILPLIVIFLISLLGLSSKKLSYWGRKNFKLVKVLLGLLFSILGIILIGGVIY